MNRKRILLVDDEIAFTRLLKLNLEQTNDYEVRIENWPEDALSAAREFRPHLVLLDVVMPRMIGGDVAARLQADATLRATPIVFLSAAVGKKWVQEHEGIVGGFPFIAKPASVEEVIDRIEQQLAKCEAWNRTATGIAPEWSLRERRPVAAPGAMRSARAATEGTQHERTFP
jgi:DNA-binding response OmpR family regulator